MVMRNHSRKILHIQILISINPFPSFGGCVNTGSMFRKQANDILHIDPDLGVALLLTFIKYQLHTKMEMDRLNIVYIFLI